MTELQAATDATHRSRLSEQLRRAHTANRQIYQDLKDSPSEESRLLMERNRLIDQALQVLSTFEKSSYTADILNRKSNRAMRATTVSPTGAETSVLRWISQMVLVPVEVAALFVVAMKKSCR